ncbi:MAG: DMT family transporter [Ruminococcaceae bacterium]|nr:DMT family transporter [Oscillospiraceae bacterium]
MNDRMIAVKGKLLAYGGLVFVIIVWGIAPMITLYFYQYYSPTIRIAFASLVGATGLFILSRKKLKRLNKTYFAVAIPTGFFLSVANILQKIGLQYTTPTHYAFLENLSVLVVPLLLFLLFKKKPTLLTVLGALLCLFSSYIISSMTASNGGAGLVGDILCALAGVFYGVNIACTGAFAKKLEAPLYLMIQFFTEMVISFTSAVVLHKMGIEKIMFDFRWQLVLANTVVVLITYTLCWLIRTNAMKHIDATVVAVVMPFSAVITAIVSIIAGSDSLTADLVIGAVLGLIAVILSGLGDRPAQKKQQ